MEKQLYRKRLLKALVVCFVINIIDFLACYLSLLDMYKRGLVNITVFNENIITGDYHTPLNYGVVQLFVYLFFIGYVMSGVRIEKIIRCSERNIYWKNHLINTVVATGAFVIIHELISVIFLLIFGNVEELISHKWIQGVIFQIISTILYYILIYLLYEIFITKFGQNVALVITAILCAIEYYCSFKIFENMWMPIDDVPLMGNLCTGIYSEMQCGMALLRLSELVLIFGFLFFKIKNKEDLLIYEKR